MRLPFHLAITENELDHLLEQYRPRVAKVIDKFNQSLARSAANTGFASAFSTEAFVVECLQPVLCDLAWDIMSAEAPRLAGLSQTQKKDQWNRATEILVARMLAPDGIAQRLLDYNDRGFLSLYRHSFRSAFFARLHNGWRSM
jgi:hypothetical protein